MGKLIGAGPMLSKPWAREEKSKPWSPLVPIEIGLERERSLKRVGLLFFLKGRLSLFIKKRERGQQQGPVLALEKLEERERKQEEEEEEKE